MHQLRAAAAAAVSAGPYAATRGFSATIALWLQTARWKSLFISSIAVLVGAAVAAWHGEWSARILVAWLGSVLIQAGTNLLNVSCNYKAAAPGADPKGSSAPVRRGLVAPEQVRRAAYVCFAIGSACGLVLVRLCGWEILLLGIPAVFAGYGYAGPGIRLAYRALGVVTVFVFMGPVMVMGSYFVVALRWSAAAAYASIAIGLVAAGIMHTNDVRDYDGDVAHGKRTLATIIGRVRASWLLLTIDAGAYLAIAAGAAAGALPWPALAVLLSLPTAIRQVRMAFVERDPAVLNEVWFLGVRLHTQFGVLLMAGLVVARLIG